MRLYEPLRRLTPKPPIIWHLSKPAPLLHIMAPPKRPRAPGKWTWPTTAAVILVKTWEIA